MGAEVIPSVFLPFLQRPVADHLFAVGHDTDLGDLGTLVTETLTNLSDLSFVDREEKLEVFAPGDRDVDRFFLRLVRKRLVEREGIRIYPTADVTCVDEVREV